MKFKSWFILAIVGCLLVASLGGWWLISPFRTIAKLDSRYRQLRMGMTTNEVQQVMQRDGAWRTNGVYRGWDGYSETTNEPQVAFALRYSVPTFYLGVTFEIVFDANGSAIGKYRYD